MSWTRLGLAGVAALSAGALIGGTTGGDETVAYTPKLQTVTEGQGPAVVTVGRNSCVVAPFRVTWGTSTNGDASQGSDYTGTGGGTVWGDCPENATSDTRTFTVPILDDDVPEEDETVALRLSVGRVSTLSTTPLPAVDGEGGLVIVDDDKLDFATADVAVREDAGVAQVTVTRHGGDPEQAYDLVWAAQEDSAERGEDFTAASGEISLAKPGDQRTVEVPLIDDDADEEDETFRVVFDHDDATWTSTVTVGDDDEPVRTTTTTTTTTTPTTTTATTATTPAPAPATVTPRASSTAKGPCVSKRRFAMRLKGLRTAVVRIDGKRMATRRGAQGLQAQINLQGKLKGRYVVKITGTTASGRKVAQIRRFRTCAPRRAG